MYIYIHILLDIHICVLTFFFIYERQGGGIAAVGCITVLISTKFVKVAVPFLYQYVLDTLGSGA
jgi:hypothetical protein